MRSELRPHQAEAIRDVDRENWRPVVGYEGLYEVSDWGRVRSVDRVIRQKNRWGNVAPRRLSGKILQPTVDKGRFAYGRLQVKLGGKSKREQRTRLVHHLVLEAFVGPRPEGTEAAHGDGNAANNRLANLRWATPLENAQDKRRHGTQLVGEAHHLAKISDNDARQIREFRGRETCENLARKYGISIAQVSRIQAGVRRAG